MFCQERIEQTRQADGARPWSRELRGRPAPRREKVLGQLAAPLVPR